MEDSLEIFIKRILDKDPALTPQELEKEIARCVGMKINEIIKKTVTDGYIALLQQVIFETLGLSCEVTPTLSLYVNVSNTSDHEISSEFFSSLSFKQALSAIAKKDFSLISPEKILDSVNEVINQASELLIHNVLLTHPLLIKISRQFTENFSEQLNIMFRDPVKIFIASEYMQNKDEGENKSHPGTYL